MLVSLTVGKVDAGVTVLLTPDKRLVSYIQRRQLTPANTNYLALVDRISFYPPSS